MGTERTLRCGFGDGDVAIASQLKEGNTESGEMEVEEMKRAAGSQPQKKLFGWGQKWRSQGRSSRVIPAGIRICPRNRTSDSQKTRSRARRTKRDVIRVHDRCCY